VSDLLFCGELKLWINRYKHALKIGVSESCNIIENIFKHDFTYIDILYQHGEIAYYSTNKASLAIIPRQGKVIYTIDGWAI
jgi:hypothetical protein